MPADISRKAGPVERGLSARELGDDRPAVRTLVEQALDAAQLALGSPEPVRHLVGHVVGESHVADYIPLWVYSPYTPRGTPRDLIDSTREEPCPRPRFIPTTWPHGAPSTSGYGSSMCAPPASSRPATSPARTTSPWPTSPSTAPSWPRAQVPPLRSSSSASPAGGPTTAETQLANAGPVGCPRARGRHRRLGAPRLPARSRRLDGRSVDPRAPGAPGRRLDRCHDGGGLARLAPHGVAGGRRRCRARRRRRHRHVRDGLAARSLAFQPAPVRRVRPPAGRQPAHHDPGDDRVQHRTIHPPHPVPLGRSPRATRRRASRPRRRAPALPRCLSQASYLVGDARTGRAVVVDPRRDVAEVLAAAAAEGLTIELVVETHFHADFLSGHLELAAATGAEIGIGAAGATEYPTRRWPTATVIDLGGVRRRRPRDPRPHPRVDLARRPPEPGEAPVAVLTGDTLFIGDVGRPDLLVAVGDRPRTSPRTSTGRCSGCSSCPTPRSCSPRTAPARPAAGRCRPRPSPRSVSSGRRTTRSARWARATSWRS